MFTMAYDGGLRKEFKGVMGIWHVSYNNEIDRNSFKGSLGFGKIQGS